MPGLTTDSHDPSDSSWQDGFRHGNYGLICDICRSLVRQDPGDTRAHLEWHERIGG